MPGEIVISKLGPNSDVLLQNLFQYYIHDMAEWFDIDTNGDGSYSYDTSRMWQAGYDVYLAKLGYSIAGFALIGTADHWLGTVGGHDVHEFFVLRRYRRTGVGQRMATLLWDRYPGEWLVRVLGRNKPAVLFWRTIIYGYSREFYKEEEHIVDGRSWRFFRFVSKGA